MYSPCHTRLPRTVMIHLQNAPVQHTHKVHTHTHTHTHTYTHVHTSKPRPSPEHMRVVEHKNMGSEASPTHTYTHTHLHPHTHTPTHTHTHTLGFICDNLHCIYMYIRVYVRVADGTVMAAIWLDDLAAVTVADGAVTTDGGDR